jgi:secreted trypsin-like serine protease
VLTAGHCSLDRTFQVRVGSKDAQEGLTYEIVNVYQYSRFSRGQAGDPVNDVKIVEISNTDRTLGVNAVTLNTNPSFPSLDTTVTVSGYGRTSSSGEVAGHLRSVTVPIVGYESCHSRYRDMTNMMNICAGSLGLDSCQGDSGSGLWTRTLSVMNQSQVTLVVSYGYGCAAANWPGVYTRVSSFSDWITAILLSTRDESDALALVSSPSKQGSHARPSALLAILATCAIVFVAIVITTVLCVLYLKQSAPKSPIPKE